MNNKLTQKNIPDGWRYERLGRIATVITGITPNTKVDEYYKGGYLFVSPADITSKYVNATVKILTKAGFDQCRKIPKGAVLFTCIGSTIGKIGIAGCDLATNQQINSVIGKKADTGFLYNQLLLRAPRIKLMAGIQAVPIVNKGLFESVDILFPPIPEQKRIVAVLDAWDDYLKGLDCKIKIKKSIKKGLMQQLLTGKKRLKSFFSQWKKTPLAKIGSFNKGAGITKDDLKKTGCNAVRYGELYTDHDFCIKKILSFISEEVAGRAKLISKGDILFAGSGETIDEIGKSAVYLFVEKCYAGGDIIVFTPRDCDSTFLAYTVNAGSCRKEIRRVGQGQSVVHVYKKDLEKILVNIPVLKEQKTIADILTKADDEIDALVKKRGLIAAQKKYLLDKLITGEIRTPGNLLEKVKTHE